jgi:hypothetical protein
MAFDLKARQRERSAEQIQQAKDDLASGDLLAVKARALAEEINAFSANHTPQPQIIVEKEVVTLSVKDQRQPHLLAITVKPDGKYEVFQLGKRLPVSHNGDASQTEMLDYILDWFAKA